MFQDEVKAKGIMSVPTVFHNDEILTSGRTNIEQLLDLIAGPVSETTFADKGILMSWLLVADRLEIAQLFMLHEKESKQAY